MNMTEIFPMSSMTPEMLKAVMPLIILGIGTTLTLILAAMKHGPKLAMVASLIVILFSASLLVQAPGTQSIGGVLNFTSMTYALMLCLHLAGLFAVLLVNSLSDSKKLLPEVYPLILFALTGMCLLMVTQHLLFQFIAVETMSLAIYVLVALRRTSRASAEAGMKYFILGGLASAMLLYGSSLLYGATGSFQLSDIAGAPSSLIKTAGFVVVMCGLFFKVGAVPFHAWVPDVYEGASLPVTGFMAAAVKFAAFIVLALVARTAMADAAAAPIIKVMLVSVAGLTMAFGNFTALVQKSVKRLLAYSSIAHTGYLLVGVLAVGGADQTPLNLYLLFYILSSMGAFGCLMGLLPENEDATIDDLAGLGLKRPLWGLGFTVFLLGMAGIPLTAGFIGKYLVFSSAVVNGHTPLVILAVLTSLAGVYYYLRLIVSLYMKTGIEADAEIPWSLSAGIVVLICTVLSIYYGLNPAPLIEMFQHL